MTSAQQMTDDLLAAEYLARVITTDDLVLAVLLGHDTERVATWRLLAERCRP